MFIKKNHFIKAGVTLSAAALFLLGNDIEASANEYNSDNWEARTVSEIKDEIDVQLENQNENEDTIDYTFQWGDTLWGVSEATDLSVDKMVQVNDIDDRSMIHVGTTIYLSDDASIISVENNDEIVSYDVSEEEVTETETPEDVEVKEETEDLEETEAAVETTETETQTETQTEAQTETQTETANEETQAAEQSNENGRWMTVEATAYSRNQPVLGNVTFSGIDLRENPRVIAVDPNVIPLGSTIYVPGYGEYVAGDTGGAIIGNRIDIHMEDLNQAIQFGRQSMDIQIIE